MYNISAAYTDVIANLIVLLVISKVLLILFVIVISMRFKHTYTQCDIICMHTGFEKRRL